MLPTIPGSFARIPFKIHRLILPWPAGASNHSTANPVRARPGSYRRVFCYHGYLEEKLDPLRINTQYLRHHSLNYAPSINRNALVTTLIPQA